MQKLHPPSDTDPTKTWIDTYKSSASAEVADRNVTWYVL